MNEQIILSKNKMMVTQGNVVGHYPRPCTGDLREHITSVVVYLGLLEAVHGGNRIASNYGLEDRRMSVLHGAFLLSHVQGRTLLAKNQPRQFFAKRDSLTDRGLVALRATKAGRSGPRGCWPPPRCTPLRLVFTHLLYCGYITAILFELYITSIYVFKVKVRTHEPTIYRARHVVIVY